MSIRAYPPPQEWKMLYNFDLTINISSRVQGAPEVPGTYSPALTRVKLKNRAHKTLDNGNWNAFYIFFELLREQPIVVNSSTRICNLKKGHHFFSSNGSMSKTLIKAWYRNRLSAWNWKGSKKCDIFSWNQSNTNSFCSKYPKLVFGHLRHSIETLKNYLIS